MKHIFRVSSRTHSCIGPMHFRAFETPAGVCAFIVSIANFPWSFTEANAKFVGFANIGNWNAYDVRKYRKWHKHCMCHRLPTSGTMPTIPINPCVCQFACLQ